MVSGPCLDKLLEFGIVNIVSKMFLEVFFEFSDGFELNHNFLVVATTLGGGSVSKMLGERFENFLGPEIR